MAHPQHVVIKIVWRNGKTEGVGEDDKAGSGGNGETRPKSKRHYQRSPPFREGPGLGLGLLYGGILVQRVQKMQRMQRSLPQREHDAL